MKQKQILPEFKEGQQVRLKKPDLTGATDGKIVEIEKVYQAVGEDGNFDMEGLATLESTVNMIQFPHEIKDDTLFIHYPATTIKVTHGELVLRARTEISKLHHYAYTVDTGKMLTLVQKKHFNVI